MAGYPLKHIISILLVASLALSVTLLPPAGKAGTESCHHSASGPAWVVAGADQSCPLAGHLACLALPGCGGIGAAAPAPPVGLPSTPSRSALDERGGARVRDLFLHGPPTPPPNS